MDGPDPARDLTVTAKGPSDRPNRPLASLLRGGAVW